MLLPAAPWPEGRDAELADPLLAEPAAELCPEAAPPDADGLDAAPVSMRALVSLNAPAELPVDAAPPADAALSRATHPVNVMLFCPAWPAADDGWPAWLDPGVWVGVCPWLCPCAFAPMLRPIPNVQAASVATNDREVMVISL
jgi:hypothetical protein